MKTKLEAALEPLSVDERRTTFRLATGATFGIDHPPHPGEPLDIVRGLLARLAELQAAQNAIHADGDLSEEGKARRLKPVADRYAEALQDAERRMAGFASRVSEIEAQAFAPPRLDKTDIVGALRDFEVRQHVRALSADDRRALMRGLSDQPDVVAAILRSPQDLGALTKAAEKAWAERAAATSEDARTALRARELDAWGREAVASIVKASRTASPMLSREQEVAAAISGRAKPSTKPVLEA